VEEFDMFAVSARRLVIVLAIVFGLAGPAATVAQEATPGPTSVDVIPGHDEATPATGLPPSVEVVASQLTNPRGFTWDADGALTVALTGIGGTTPGTIGGAPDGQFGGPTAAVVRIEDGCPVPVAEGLPSSAVPPIGWIWGVADVAFLDGQLYALVAGGGSDYGNFDTPNGVYRVEDDGAVSLVADLSAWFRANPPAFSSPDYNADGSLFGMEAATDRLWITEAVGGRVLTVTPDGTITLVADLSEQHPVLTGLALDPDGGVYVGNLTAIPYPAGAAKVVHVAEDGTVTDAWTGLTRITGIAVGPDGTLYAAQLAAGDTEGDDPHTGRNVRQTGPGSLEDVATELYFPVGLGGDGDGALYVALPGIVTGAGEGQGALLRLDVSTAPVSLAGTDALAPVCSLWPGATPTA